MFKTKLLTSTPDLLHLPVAFPISANGSFILPQVLRPQALPSSLPSLLHLPIHLIVTPSNRVGCLFQCAQNPPTSYHYHHGPCRCSSWCKETRDGLPSCLASIVCLVLKSWVSRQVATSFRFSLSDGFSAYPPTLLHFWPQDIDFPSHLLKNNHHQ